MAADFVLTGTLSAYDVTTNKIAWQQKFNPDPAISTSNFLQGAQPGTLTTAGNLLLIGVNHRTATIEDPETWERPWTIAMPLTHDPRPVMAFECHEHNYGLVNILKAARAADER